MTAIVTWIASHPLTPPLPFSIPHGSFSPRDPYSIPFNFTHITVNHIIGMRGRGVRFVWYRHGPIHTCAHWSNWFMLDEIDFEEVIFFFRKNKRLVILKKGFGLFCKQSATMSLCVNVLFCLSLWLNTRNIDLYSCLIAVL